MLIVNFIFFSPVQAQNIQIDSIFTSDGEIFPFEPNDIIYGLSISGSVTLLTDTSLVRVILTDNSGNEWMVYEAYPMIVDDSITNFTHDCDETCYLPGIIPVSLKMQINYSHATILELITETEFKENIEQLHQQSLKSRELMKISKINSFLEENEMLWRADETMFSGLPYQEKKSMFGEKYSLFGYDFYGGGIYSPYRFTNSTRLESNLVDNFDWRNRHGANIETDSGYFDGNQDKYIENCDTHSYSIAEQGNGWMTAVKNQKMNNHLSGDYPQCKPDCIGTCYIYSCIAVIEALINLYFVRTDKGMDLSEQQVLDCSVNSPCDGGYMNNVSDYLKDTGVIEESYYPWQDGESSCDYTSISNSPYQMTIEGWWPVDKLNIDAIKEAIITKGPLVAGIKFPDPLNPNVIDYHAMALVGFGTIKANDHYHWSNGGQIIVPPGNENIGKLYWIFKQSSSPSWGGDGGYWYMLSDQYFNSNYFTNFYKYAPFSEPYVEIHDLKNNLDETRNCYDKDSDGYCFWGIGNRAGCLNCQDCPEDVKLEDCDDSNPRIGPYAADYSGTPIAPEMEVTCISGQITPLTNHGFYFFNENNVTLTFQIKNPGSANLHLVEFPCPVSITGPDSDHFTNLIQPNSEIRFDGTGTSVFSMQFGTDESGKMHEAHLKIGVRSMDLDVLEDFEFELVYNGCSLTGQDYHVTGYKPYNGYNLIPNDIYIERGGTMEVFGSLAMYPESDIFVEPGGHLIINGGLATGTTGICNNLWHGIDIWGASNQPQTLEFQGMVSVMNQGCIEYAETAIETVICPGCEKPLPTGGIVSCSDAIFKDNINDVHLYPYTNRNPVNHQILPNFSRFFMTIFKTTDDLFTISGNSPSTHLYLDNVGGLIILGCSITNYSTRINESRGKGIESYHAGYFVSPACAVGNIIPCPELIPCRFENLDYGIRAFNNYGYFTITLNSAEFIYNRRGIYLGLVENPTIISCTFDISDPEHFWPQEPLVGLYLDEFATGFVVEENNFEGESTYSPTFTYGIYLLNVDTSYNEIYNNNFKKLRRGIQAVGDNRNADKGNGVCLKCNDFTDCQTDIVVTYDEDENGHIITDNTGIAFFQGKAGDGDPTLAAGNRFSSNPAGVNYLNDVGCKHIEYTYQAHIPIPSLVPDYYGAYFHLNADNDATFSKETSCPSHLGGGITLSLEMNSLTEETSHIASYQDTLSMVVDGGNTMGLNYDVLTSYPGEALAIRQELLDQSPYLSDTVMISAIEKEDVLPEAMIRDILVQNPQAPKSDRILSALDDRHDTIPGYMLEEIMEGLNTYGDKELLEQKLGEHMVKRDRAWNKLNLYYKNDTVNMGASFDSLLSLYQNENLLSAKYQLASLYLDQDDSINAFSVLSSIPNEFNLSVQELSVYNDYQELFNIFWEINKDTTALDSIKIQTLYELSSEDQSVPGIFAANLLIKDRIINYNEPVRFVEITKSAPIAEKKIGIAKPTKHLTVFPNPAGNYFIVEYNLPDPDDHGVLTISDIHGKKLQAFTLKDSRNQIIIPSNEFSAGNYSISLTSKNQIIDTQKLTISR